MPVLVRASCSDAGSRCLRHLFFPALAARLADSLASRCWSASCCDAGCRFLRYRFVFNAGCLALPTLASWCWPAQAAPTLAPTACAIFFFRRRLPRCRPPWLAGAGLPQLLRCRLPLLALMFFPALAARTPAFPDQRVNGWIRRFSKLVNASTGNRTRVTSMATMYSTTRPLMPRTSATAAN